MEAVEVEEGIADEEEAEVLVVVVVGEPVVVIEAAAAGEFAEEDGTVVAATVAVGCMPTDMKDMASWPKDTILACHNHRMGVAEDRHYCRVSAVGFARVDTAVVVDNAGIGRNQVVESSSPRETNRTHITRV